MLSTHPSARWGLAALLAVAAVLLLVGSSAVAGQATVRAESIRPHVSHCGTLNLSTPICHVYLVFLENQNVNYVLNHGPFESYLAAKYAFAANYYSVEHFSFPNYLAATSGTVTNHEATIPKKNVIDLIRARSPSPTWAGYYEQMPSPCDRNATGVYKPAHNPFVWYASVWNNQSDCRSHDVSFASWNATVNSSSNATLPNYAFFGPNASHSCWVRGQGVHACDPWLRSWLSPLVNDSFFAHTVFFITYDEGVFGATQGANGTQGGGHVYTVAVSPYACPGFRSTYNYSHFNLLTTTEWLLGLNRTGVNDSWSKYRPMTDLFCFPPGSVGSPVQLTVPSGSLAPSSPVAVAGRPPLLRH